MFQWLYLSAAVGDDEEFATNEGDERKEKLPKHVSRLISTDTVLANRLALDVLPSNAWGHPGVRAGP